MIPNRWKLPIHSDTDSPILLLHTAICRFPTQIQTEKDTITVSVDVTNTGNVAGKEAVQLYVKDMTASTIRPEKELKGFEKVQLAPGETKTVTMKLDKRSFAWYNTQLHDWYAASGKYEVLIGASSRDIRLSETIELSSSQDNSHAYSYEHNTG